MEINLSEGHFENVYVCYTKQFIMLVESLKRETFWDRGYVREFKRVKTGKTVHMGD